MRTTTNRIKIQFWFRILSSEIFSALPNFLNLIIFWQTNNERLFWACFLAQLRALAADWEDKKSFLKIGRKEKLIHSSVQVWQIVLSLEKKQLSQPWLSLSVFWKFPNCQKKNEVEDDKSLLLSQENSWSADDGNSGSCLCSAFCPRDQKQEKSLRKKV